MFGSLLADIRCPSPDDQRHFVDAGQELDLPQQHHSDTVQGKKTGFKSQMFLRGVYLLNFVISVFLLLLFLIVMAKTFPLVCILTPLPTNLFLIFKKDCSISQ